MNTYITREIGTSFVCEWCGETDYGYVCDIIDGFEWIPKSIETICIYCAEQYS